MLEICRDARESVWRGAHKKMCRDGKHILLSQLPVPDAGWSCNGRSVVNPFSDASYLLLRGWAPQHRMEEQLNNRKPLQAQHVPALVVSGVADHFPGLVE